MSGHILSDKSGAVAWLDHYQNAAGLSCGALMACRASPLRVSLASMSILSANGAGDF